MKLSPLDDIETYRAVADKAYAQKTKDAIRNPKAVLAAQEAEAMAPAAASAPSAPAAAATGPKFTKGFSPEERAAQAKALQDKLKNRE